MDSREHYANLDLEDIFSRGLIDNAFNFRKIAGLQFVTIKDALKHEEKIDLIQGDEPSQSPRKFETALVIEAFKQRS